MNAMRTVLIIDDETATLTMFRLFLKAYGYEVLVAEDGPSGLELARKEYGDCAQVQYMIDFFEASKRGVIRRTEV